MTPQFHAVRSASEAAIEKGACDWISLTADKRDGIWGTNCHETNQRRQKISIRLDEEGGGKILVIHVSGKLVKEDYVAP